MEKQKIIGRILIWIIFLIWILTAVSYYAVLQQNKSLNWLSNIEQNKIKEYNDIIKKQKRDISWLKNNYDFLKDFKKRKEELSLIEVKDFLEYVLPKNSMSNSVGIRLQNNTITFNSVYMKDVVDFLTRIDKNKEYFTDYSFNNVSYDKSKKLYSTTVNFNVWKIRCFLLQRLEVNYYSIVLEKQNYNEMKKQCLNNNVDNNKTNTKK